MILQARRKKPSLEEQIAKVREAAAYGERCYKHDAPKDTDPMRYHDDRCVEARNSRECVFVPSREPLTELDAWRRVAADLAEALERIEHRALLVLEGKIAPTPIGVATYDRDVATKALAAFERLAGTIEQSKEG